MLGTRIRLECSGSLIRGWPVKDFFGDRRGHGSFRGHYERSSVQGPHDGVGGRMSPRSTARSWTASTATARSSDHRPDGTHHPLAGAESLSRCCDQAATELHGANGTWLNPPRSGRGSPRACARPRRPPCDDPCGRRAGPPALERREAIDPRQQGEGRFVQIRAQHRIAGFRDPPRILDLTQLVATRGQTHVGGHALKRFG